MTLVYSERRRPVALKSPVPQPATRARSLRDYAAVAAILLLGYAGVFRLNPLLSWIPLNLTVLGAALTGVGVLAAAGRDTIPRGTGPVLVLWALFMPAAILHAPGSYADSMVTDLYTLTILSALGPLFLMRSKVRQELWVIMQIILASVLAGGALLSSHPQLAADGSGVYLAGSNTINSGDMAAVVVLSCSILALTRRRWRGPMLALGGAAGVTMFAIGSRGPVLAVAVALATVATFAPASRVYRTVRITTITFVIFLVWYFLRGDTTGGTGRIATTLLAGSDQDITSQIRLSLWREAWDVIPGHFWGLGWGGLSDLGPLRGSGLLWQSDVPYPHDIWLQVTAEAGWIAGAALIVFVWCSLRRLRTFAASPYAAVLFGMAVFWVTQASLSGDPNDFRCMWMTLAISWVAVGSQVQGGSIGSASGMAPFGFNRDM
jgi:hypothetical protein